MKISGKIIGVKIEDPVYIFKHKIQKLKNTVEGIDINALNEDVEKLKANLDTILDSGSKVIRNQLKKFSIAIRFIIIEIDKSLKGSGLSRPLFQYY